MGPPVQNRAAPRRMIAAMQAPAKQPVSVLVVDDDPDIRESIRLFLEAHGYAVTTARDGAEGLERLTVDPPDVLLLDLMMPGMSGTELMVRMRELRLHIPTVVISADTEAPRRLRGQAAEGMLIKPFSLASLLPIIERQARRGAGARAGDPQP